MNLEPSPPPVPGPSHDWRAWARSEGSTLAVGALALVVFLVWEWRDGGFASTDWLPGGLFLLGLLVTLLLAVGGAPRLSRALLVSIAFLAAFTVWNACSIAWAEVRGVAWDGTNRTLVYLVVFALFAIPAWSRRSTALLLGAFSLGVAAVGAYAFFHTTAAHPLDAFVSGRLAVPLEYPNAVACLYLSALWPALYLAARRTTPPVVRGLMLAAAGVLIDLSILCQSRGSLVALPATALVFLLVVPMRLRLITIVVPLAAAVGLGAATLIHVSQAILYQDGAVRAIDAARSTIVTTAIALFVLGAILGLVDSRVVLPRRVVRIAGATLTAVALATAAVTTIVVTAFEHPIDRVTTGWNEFKADVENDATRPHLITGFGSKRYDLWRVSLIELRRHPVGGIGSDNFAAAYLRERRTTEEPLYPHGLPFRLAAGTGVVGILLFLGWLIAALWAFAAAGGARSRDTQALACSALAVPVYWLLQGAVDWFWEIPVLAAPAFAAMALAIRTTDDGAPLRIARSSPWLIAGVCAAALVPALSLTAPWLSAREVQGVSNTWFTDPARAFDRLDQARRFDPLSDDADLVAGVIARRLREPARERAAFARAVERNPSNWYTWLELALIDAAAGRHEAAAAEAAQARRLNPHDPLVVRVTRRIEDRLSVDQTAVERRFTNRLQPILRGR